MHFEKTSSLRSATVALTLVFSACAPSRPPAPLAPAPRVEAPERLEESEEVLKEEARPARPSLLGDAPYDLPVEANTWVEAELSFLIEERRSTIERWLQRGESYEGFIKEVLRASGVPTDLYYLAMIESGFVPSARSHAGAVGMWQFMPGTGRWMGLRVDSQVDERMDPVRSTRAAARHLRGLYQTHGNWALAAAAYNAGSGRISRGLQQFAVSNFWDLAVHGDLAKETRHYVPRLYAVAILGHNRERFGLPPADSLNASTGFVFDSLYVEYATPLSELARMGDVPVEALERLNPHLLRSATPSGGYWVWAPAGTGVALQRAWLASDFRKHQGYGTYTVRPGDFLGRIAERAGMKMARVRELNPAVNFANLQIGEELRLPYAVAQALEARPVEKAAAKEVTVAVAEVKAPVEDGGATGSAAEHRVQAGETLWSIAHQYSLEVEEIQRANRRTSTVIRPGEVLTIPRPAAEREAAPAGARTAAKHVVRSGETLWSIAREYESSVAAIQEANHLDGQVIAPGQELTIPR